MTGRTKSPGAKTSQPVSVPNGALAVHVSAAEGAPVGKPGAELEQLSARRPGANRPRLVQRQEVALRCVDLFHPVDVAFEDIPIVDRNIALGLGND